MPRRSSTKARRNFIGRFTDRPPGHYVRCMTPSSECADPPAPFGPLFFERVLSPHRSLPARGFHLLMGLLGLISLAVGVGFVYLAFRFNYRSARQSETLRFAGDAFTVERVSVRGERRSWRFQPFWLRVVIEERPDASNRLLVASHGRSLVIGDFVPPTTRRDLAVTSTEALVRWRKSFNPAVDDDEK